MTTVYALCALISAACAIALSQLFWRHRHRTTRLVFWSTVSFAWFAVSNALVFADLVMLQPGELVIARAATACVAGALLLFGLIWETE